MNLTTIVTALAAVYTALKAFIGPTANSFLGYVNVAELARAVIAAFAAAPVSGGAAAVLVAVLSAVQADASGIFPADAALAGAVLTFVVDLIRRFGHGEPPPAKPTLAV
jgi:hypothetical protein